VVVAATNFPNGKPIEIYYPSETAIGEQMGCVLFVAGNSDVEIRAEEGRPWLHSNQVLGWGRLVAEHGLIGIAYENDGHPDDSLKAIGEWVVEYGSDYGIDSQDVGLWSASSGCGVAADAFRVGGDQFGGVKPRFGVFFYGVIPLRSDQDVSVPLFVAYAQRDSHADCDEIERFIARYIEHGGTVESMVHSTKDHAFDVRGENEETSQIINAALSFMVWH
jgi:acetyl esterase/lipase